MGIAPLNGSLTLKRGGSYFHSNIWLNSEVPLHFRTEEWVTVYIIFWRGKRNGTCYWTHGSNPSCMFGRICIIGSSDAKIQLCLRVLCGLWHTVQHKRNSGTFILLHSSWQKYGIYTRMVALNSDKYRAWTKIGNLKLINFVLYHMTLEY